MYASRLLVWILCASPQCVGGTPITAEWLWAFPPEGHRANRVTSMPDSQPQAYLLDPLDERPEGKLCLLEEPRSGDLCPKCRSAHLDYDGLLNLTCPDCGYNVGGCFT